MSLTWTGYRRVQHGAQLMLNGIQGPSQWRLATVATEAAYRSNRVYYRLAAFKLISSNPKVETILCLLMLSGNVEVNPGPQLNLVSVLFVLLLLLLVCGKRLKVTREEFSATCVTRGFLLNAYSSLRRSTRSLKIPARLNLPQLRHPEFLQLLVRHDMTWNSTRINAKSSELVGNDGMTISSMVKPYK